MNELSDNNQPVGTESPLCNLMNYLSKNTVKPSHRSILVTVKLILYFLQTILLWTPIVQYLLSAYSLKYCSVLDTSSLDYLHLKSYWTKFKLIVASFLVMFALSQ